MKTLRTDELRARDVVDYHGIPHRIVAVERQDGWSWPVAFGEAGWAMALGNGPVFVLDRTDPGSVGRGSCVRR